MKVKPGRSKGKYLLDANVLMTAHRSYYAFDLCPGFWAAIVAGCAAGRIRSTRRVLAEVKRNNDALTKWVADELPPGFFLDDSVTKIASEFAPMMQWVAAGKFKPAAKAKFAKDADGWLAATAKSGGFTLVTQEARSDDAKARVPLPNVCVQFAVEYCDTFDMLRKLSCSFA